MKKKKCVVCEDTFMPTSGRQKYCSEICRGDAIQVQTKDRAAKFYKNNKDKILEKNKEIAEKRNEYAKEYFKTDAGKSVRRRYYQKNKEYFHQKVRERRAREKKDKSDN